MDDHRSEARCVGAAPALTDAERSPDQEAGHRPNQHWPDGQREPGSESEGKQGRKHASRKHLPDLRPHAMSYDGVRAAAAVTHVLTKERARLFARKVYDVDCPCEPDLSARAREPNVELGVFVVAQGLVIAADREKALQVEQRVMTVIDEFCFAIAAVCGATGSEHGILRDGCRALKA